MAAPVSMWKFNVKSLPLAPMGVNILYVSVFCGVKFVEKKSKAHHKLFVFLSKIKILFLNKWKMQMPRTHCGKVTEKIIYQKLLTEHY